MTRATRFILDAVRRSEASGITVDCDSAYSTVSIDATGLAEGCDGVYLQGDEADQFVAERDALTKRYPSLTDYEAEMALAWPYAENCFD